MTTREQQDAPAAACRVCKHELVDKSKFCDNCGAATTSLVSDWETLQHYCGRCGSVLRSAKKYCTYCGEASPHSGQKKAKNEHWLFQAAEDPKMQIGAVLLLVFFASLPLFLPVRYGLTWMPPFFLVYDDGAPPVPEQNRAPLATASWSARSLLSDEDFAGENGLQGVSGVARGAGGEYYVSDPAAHTVQRIARDGVREIVAGIGAPGFSGDGGPAAAARLNTPLGLATDPQGNLYIADSGNGRIRVVDADGVIRTIAGCGAGCGQRSAVQAAALSILLHPAEITFAGANLLVSETPQPESAERPAVWVLQPEL